MENPLLNNLDEFPDDRVLSVHLGETKQIWDAMESHINSEYPLFAYNWKFYKDGHSWLCKITLKTKTICWISIWQGLFKVTFYFGDKAEQLIVNSELETEFIDQFVSGKHYGKIRGITVDTCSMTHLNTIWKLIDIRLKMK